jgi:hypothetical protein
MMTKGNTNFSNETEKFNHAVDLFFGMNPEKRLWILLMFYTFLKHILNMKIMEKRFFVTLGLVR